MDQIIAAIKRGDIEWLDSLSTLKAHGVAKVSANWSQLRCAAMLPLDVEAYQSAFLAACQSDNPDAVRWVLANTGRNLSWKKNGVVSRVGPPILSPWHAVTNATGSVNSARVAAAIIGSDQFTGFCMLKGAPPDNWQSMCALLCHTYKDDTGVWNAVLSNSRLNEGSHTFAKMVMKLA